MTLDAYTLAGILGTALIVVTYFVNQQGRLKSDDWKYPTANLFGAILILVSLTTAWNLPTAIVECFWAAISLYGLIWRAPHR